MRRYQHLASVYPGLQETRIDVDQSRPPEASHHSSWGSVMQINQKIGVGDGIDCQTLPEKLGARRLTVCPDRDLGGESIGLKSPPETRKLLCSWPA
jgi:hypothetical protein